MSKRSSNQDLLNGLKKQLQKVLFDQQQLLHDLEVHNLIPEHDAAKSLIFDSKTVPEMKSVLQGEYSKLEKFDVVLAVVGTMKAGKSTTINAIVGREILPNRNRPMTSLPTLIAHKKNQKEPVLACDVKAINAYLSKLKKLPLLKYSEDERVSSYKEIIELIKNIKEGYKFKNHYKGEDSIFSFLASLNDLVRLSRIVVDKYPELGFPFAAYKEINSLPRIDIEFTELAQQDEQLGNLVLLDTPGPNEADIPELRNIFEQQLKRSSAVMVVLDYAQLKSQADADIRGELKKLPKIDEDRLFALVNQFDRKDAHGDSEYATKEIVLNDLLKGEVKLENIYCISALNAFLANTVLTIIQKEKSKPQFSNTRVEDFAKKAFGESDAKEDWEDASLDKIQKRAIKMIESSNIKMPLQNIIHESYKNAPEIAMKSALRDVANIFDNISNYFSVHGSFSKEYQMTEKELDKIKDSLSKLDSSNKVLNQHASESLTEVNNSIKKSSSEIFQKIKIFEEESPKLIKREVEETIEYFLQQKEEEYDERVGKSIFGKVVKFLILNENYAKYKSELKAEIDDLSKTFEQGDIKLQVTEMKKLNAKIEEKLKYLESDYKRSLENILDPILIKFNLTIERINTEIIEDISKISKEFGKTGIDIKILPLDLDFKNIQASMKLNLSELSEERKESRQVESTSTFSGISRWFGKLFNDDWGYETSTTTYKVLSFNKLVKNLENGLSNFVVKPLQQHLDQNFKKFKEQINTDLNKISVQIEKLTNELQDAFQAEQLPYDVKKKRKDAMSLIDQRNKSIQLEINLINQQLPVVLAGVFA